MVPVATEPYRYVFGPALSRRLGRSLGVDVLPFKTCTYDCVYCQLGRTTDRTVEVVVRDDTAVDSATATTTITIVTDDDAPAVDLDADDSAAPGIDFATTFTEGGGAIAVADTDTAISDPDSTQLSRATITLTNPQASDALSVGGVLPGGISVDPASTATSIILTGINRVPFSQGALFGVHSSSNSECGHLALTYAMPTLALIVVKG